jgi:glycosyltransferase involved in cell wall biosynthesis
VAVYDLAVSRVLMFAPPSPHTDKWLGWIDSLPDWEYEFLEYGLDLPDLFGRSRLGTVASLLRGIRRLRAVPYADVVHAHWLAGPGWIGAAANRRPLVISVWGSDILVHARSGRLGELLTRLAAARADAVTYDAEVLAEALVRAGFDQKRLHRIVLGPNSHVFQSTPRGNIASELGVPSGAKVVLSPRGLAAVYQPEVAVGAFAAAAVDDSVMLVRADRSDVKGREALDASARRHGVTDRILTYDAVATERLPELFSAADVVLSVPRSDGTSVTILEALFCDRPVVATDLPANREWLPPELLAPVGDAASLGAVLRRALTDEDWASALAMQAGCHAREEADEGKQIDAIKALYARVASGQRR